MDSSMGISTRKSHSKMQVFSSFSPFGVGRIKKFSLSIGGQMVCVCTGISLNVRFSFFSI